MPDLETTPRRRLLDGDLYVDRHGKRYTTCPAASQDDPWWGATILTGGVVRDLDRRGLLPLTEVVHSSRVDQTPRRPWWHRLLTRRASTRRARP